MEEEKEFREAFPAVMVDTNLGFNVFGEPRPRVRLDGARVSSGLTSSSSLSYVGRGRQAAKRCSYR